jgi:hypothetical protein
VGKLRRSGLADEQRPAVSKPRAKGGYEHEREYRWKRSELVCSVFTGAVIETAGALNSGISCEETECGG